MALEADEPMPAVLGWHPWFRRTLADGDEPVRLRLRGRVDARPRPRGHPDRRADRAVAGPLGRRVHRPRVGARARPGRAACGCRSRRPARGGSSTRSPITPSASSRSRGRPTPSTRGPSPSTRAPRWSRRCTGTGPARRPSRRSRPKPRLPRRDDLRRQEHAGSSRGLRRSHRGSRRGRTRPCASGPTDTPVSSPEQVREVRVVAHEAGSLRVAVAPPAISATIVRVQRSREPVVGHHAHAQAPRPRARPSGRPGRAARSRTGRAPPSSRPAWSRAARPAACPSSDSGRRSSSPVQRSGSPACAWRSR